MAKATRRAMMLVFCLLVFCLLVFYYFKRVQVAVYQSVVILELVFLGGKIVKPFLCARPLARIYIVWQKWGEKLTLISKPTGY